MITLTDRVTQHVSRYLTHRGKGVGLRVGVKAMGCPGLACELECVDEIAIEGRVFEPNDIKVVVDPKNLPYIDGTEPNCAREGPSEGFRFNNPDVEDKCSCGELFRM